MEVACRACGKLQDLDEKAFGNRESVQVKCVACGQSFRVISPKTQALKVETTRKTLPDVTSDFTADGRPLSLPKGKVLSLRVLEGKEKGTVFAIAKPRLTIGRSNADVTVDDPLVSRLHCALEIMEEWVLLRDLGSTNGTLVDNRPITNSTLASGSTFRAGNHIFQLLIGPQEK